MKAKGILTLLLLAGFTLAGCLGDDAEGDGGAGASGDDCDLGLYDSPDIRLTDPSVDPINQDADAWDFEATNIRTCSLPAIGWHPLRGDPADPAGSDPHNYLGEIDMRGDLDLGAVAVLGLNEQPMVYLLDISDRARPTVLSTISQAATYLVDVKISDDGDYLFAASQNLPTNAAEIVTFLPEDPVGLAGPNGFTIYDIRDRASPQFVMTVPSVDDIGCHMLSHEIIAGTDVVFCVGQHVRAHGLIRTPAGPWGYLGAFDYMLPDGSGTLAPGACVNDIIIAGDPTGLLCSGPHDMTVGVDEVDGTTLMTVSHWDEGLRVVDISDPDGAGFVTLGGWNGEGATHYSGNVHTAMTFWVGDTRYVVASPELTSSGTVPSLWILDGTDLSDLKFVGEWFHPGEYDSLGLYMTTHQWQVAPTGTNVSVEDVRIYMTYNHNGIWVLDFAKMLEGDHQGAILGYNLARMPLVEADEVANARLATWDVGLVDGHIYGSDRATGLWVFHYEGDELGDPALNGFA
ncbi:MAG: LVIVD repeat-containing protein [Thermoplasmatota archaeon]